MIVLHGTSISVNLSSNYLQHDEDKRKLYERERAVLEKRYTLPDSSHIIVHPSRMAKSGKFDCTVMSLSVLLDYRPEDTKVSLCFTNYYYFIFERDTICIYIYKFLECRNILLKYLSLPSCSMKC